LQDLKNSLLNNPINSFGLADPFDYLLDKEDYQKKEGQFIYFENDIPEGFVEIEQFCFLDGEQSLILVVKDPQKQNYD